MTPNSDRAAMTQLWRSPHKGHRFRDAQPDRSVSSRLRSAGLALSPTSARDVRELIELDLQLRAAVPSRRRIAVLALKSGVGSTTVSALIAQAFAARRTDPVLLVDASSESARPMLHELLDTQPVKGISELAAAPPTVTGRADLQGQLTPVGRDMWLLPSDPVAPGGHRPTPGEQVYAAATAPFARYFDITVTDLGTNPDAGTARLLLSQAHALCLVTDAAASSISHALGMMRQLRGDGGAPWLGRVVLLANQLSPQRRFDAADRARRAAIRTSHTSGLPVVSLGHDPALQTSAQRRTSLEPATEVAGLRVAAALLGVTLPGRAA